MEIVELVTQMNNRDEFIDSVAKIQQELEKTAGP